MWGHEILWPCIATCISKLFAPSFVCTFTLNVTHTQCGGLKHAVLPCLSMHFIRGWPWQPSWSRVVSGVFMSRRSSNRVAEQQSSSSNTTAPTDTPSGTSQAHTHTNAKHNLHEHSLPSDACVFCRQQPPNEKTEPSCAQDSEVPAPMPPQVRHKTFHSTPHKKNQQKTRTHSHTHYRALTAHWHTCPHHTWC